MPLRPLLILNVVGLTPRHLGPNTPRLSAIAAAGFSAPMAGVLPAVTCTAQASLLTGTLPQEHGVVGNGRLFRDTGEVRFWQQSNRLIQGETLYAAARRIAGARGEPFTCAKMFWWFNQGAPVDRSVTPKPHYGADGSKVFDIQSTPAGLAAELTREHGAFPFHTFWGPGAGLPCSDWIAAASASMIRRHKPTLTLVYLPHLDYDLQRFGPDAACVPERLRQVDAAAGKVLDAAGETGAAVLVVSEYGLMPVKRPVYLNRVLRQSGRLAVRDGPFGEMLDTFGSPAFAVVDHQLAHVCVADPANVDAVAKEVEAVPGVARVAVGSSRRELGLDHPHSGEIVALSERDAWFAYPYWLDDRKAPDFARTVDIHRKPGYDPCELFFDPKLPFPKLKAGLKLVAKKLGFRYLMNVIPLDAAIVKGSHGVEPADALDGPLLIGSEPGLAIPSPKLTDVKAVALRAMGLG
jgi:predicted AlkP superfamily pyrophosphatase or phosphodiesterase